MQSILSISHVVRLLCVIMITIGANACALDTGNSSSDPDINNVQQGVKVCVMPICMNDCENVYCTIPTEDGSWSCTCGDGFCEVTC
jgi:hypothetical protein